MGLHRNADGSVDLWSEADSGVTTKIAKGKTDAQRDAAIAKFFADNPDPEPPSAVERVASVLAGFGLSLDDLKAALA